MKHRVLCLALAIFMFLCIPAAMNVSAEGEQHVWDLGDILSTAELESLDRKASDLSQAYGYGVYIVTQPEIPAGYMNVERYAEDYYGASSLGIGEEHDGMLLMLCMEERKFCLTTHGHFGNRVLTPYGREKMQDQFIDNFKDDDWYGGFEDYLEQAEFYLAQDAKGQPYDETYRGPWHPIKCVLIAFLVSSVVALVVCFIFKAQMNTAMKQLSASAYVDKNGVAITYRKDRYTHTTTTRTKIETNSSSSGGSRSSGGGYSSSSGSF